jgi:hypothetical protein
LANVSKKHFFNFEIYADASLQRTLCSLKRGKAKNGYEVVNDLVLELLGLGHIFFTKNLFIFVKVLVNMVERSIYCTRMVMGNHIGLLHDLTNNKKILEQAITRHHWLGNALEWKKFVRHVSQ